MPLSVELTLLIESCKVALFKGNTDKMVEILQSQKIDWQKLQDLAGFHRIRPTVYTAFKKCPADLVNPKAFKYLQEFTTQQIIANMLNARELEYILTLLQQAGVRVLPYKGYTIVQAWYRDNPIREIGDVDILVHPDDAAKGLHILLENGYKFDLKDIINESWSDKELIEIMLTSNGKQEATLKKTEDDKIRFEIDFHWGLYAGFYNYNVPAHSLFVQNDSIELSNTTTSMFTKDNLLLTTVLHHGGFENWVRLRNLCDLAMFIGNMPDTQNWEPLLQKAKMAKLENTFLWGLYLVKVFFEISLPTEIEARININQFNKIYKTVNWNTICYYERQFIPKIQHIQLWIKLQDKPFSTFKFFKKYIAFQSTPSVLEAPRLITFPERFTLLNLLSKIITYIWRKGF